MADYNLIQKAFQNGSPDAELVCTWVIHPFMLDQLHLCSTPPLDTFPLSSILCFKTHLALFLTCVIRQCLRTGPSLLGTLLNRPLKRILILPKHGFKMLMIQQTAEAAPMDANIITQVNKDAPASEGAVTEE